MCFKSYPLRRAASPPPQAAAAAAPASLGLLPAAGFTFTQKQHLGVVVLRTTPPGETGRRRSRHCRTPRAPHHTPRRRPSPGWWCRRIATASSLGIGSRGNKPIPGETYLPST